MASRTFFSFARRRESAKPPAFMGTRSSVYFIATVTGMGLLTDVCLFPLFTPAIPFRLEALGYDQISSLTGWLSAAYAAGLIIATFPFVWLGSRTRSKRNLLLAALTSMAVGVVILMVIPNYGAMVAGRILQGASGAGIWTLGLALVADNCDPQILGKIMGLAMIGYSIGTSIGQPIGGVLYGQLGWYAPSVFALILILFDFVLRAFVLEKHEVSRYKHQRSSDVALEVAVAEQAAFTQEQDITITPGQVEEPSTVADQISIGPSTHKQPEYDQIRAIGYLLFNLKPLTGLLISFLNGFLTSGFYNTALVLRLNQRYGLDATKAGLVFFAVAIPAGACAPFSGYFTDRWGPRPLSLACCIGYLPALCILMVEQLPLPAFIVMLGFTGICSGLINAPVMVYLAYAASSSNGVIGTSHVYGAFNMAFSLSAFIGPIVAGQLLEKLGIPTGFKIQIAITCALSLCCVPLAFIYMNPHKMAAEKARQEERTQQKLDDKATSLGDPSVKSPVDPLTKTASETPATFN